MKKTGIPEFSPTSLGTLVPEMLQEMRNRPIHGKTTQAQSPFWWLFDIRRRVIWSDVCGINGGRLFFKGGGLALILSLCEGGLKLIFAQWEGGVWLSFGAPPSNYCTVPNYDHKQRTLKHHKPWPFEPIEVNFCSYPKRSAEMIDGSKNANVS